MKTKQILFMALISLFAVAVFSGCIKIDTGSSISGTWTRNESYSGSASRNEYNHTLKFTSNKAGKYTRTGWFQVYQYSAGGKWSAKEQVNEAKDFTFIYSDELKEGVITMGGKESVFSVSSSGKELNWGGTYSRK
jgi:hypothetical protein